jgi:hypothetical protein
MERTPQRFTLEPLTDDPYSFAILNRAGDLIGTVRQAPAGSPSGMRYSLHIYGLTGTRALDAFTWHPSLGLALDALQSFPEVLRGEVPA